MKLEAYFNRITVLFKFWGDLNISTYMYINYAQINAKELQIASVKDIVLWQQQYPSCIVFITVAE